MLTISVFARRVGLTPSALRFYDDCGLLRPLRVDPVTGYRFYGDEQQDRGLLLRDLREIGLPLADVRAVLDGDPAAAAEIVLGHVRTLEERVGPARRMAARILGSLPGWRVVLSGAEFASAVRQVAPAAASGGEFPALGGVLLDLDPDEVTLVATDRYRLAVRVLQPRRFEGAPRQLLVPAPVLSELGRWAARGAEVRLDADGITVGDESRPLPTMDHEYPDYRGLLAKLGEPVSRAMVDRVALLGRLTGGTACLEIGDDRVVVSSPESGDRTVLDAICTGEPVRVLFGVPILAAALDASVGPDVLLELAGPDRPVLVRSADQGTFTTIAMPIRDESHHRVPRR